jgi:hypothetical protein
MKNYYLLSLLFISNFGNTVLDVSCQPSKISYKNKIKTSFVPISQGLLLYLQYHQQKKNTKNIFDLNYFYDFQITNNSSQIASHLYGKNTISIENNEFGNSWNPHYFGLTKDTAFSASIKPTIINQIFNFEFCYHNESGFWIQADIPVTYSIWEMKTSQNQGNLGTAELQNYGKIYLQADQSGNISGGQLLNNMANINSAEQGNELFQQIPGTISLLTNNNNNPQPISTGQASQLTVAIISDSKEISAPRPVLLKPNMTMSLAQQVITPPKNLAMALNGYTYGNLQTYEYNKIPFTRGTNTAWQVANILLMFGWDKVFSECMTGGIYCKCILPSGTTIDKEWNTYSFSPVVGNGNRFQLGGGVNAFYTWYDSSEYSFTFHGDCYATYVFPANQWRSFDKIHSPLSRYITIKEFNPLLQYTSNDFPLGDKNANFYNISNNIEIEGVINLLYRYKNLIIDYGYTCIYLSKEVATQNCHTNQKNKNLYGYKGETTAQNITVSSTPSAGTTWNTNSVEISLEPNNNVSENNSIFYNPLTSSLATKDNLFVLPEEINNSGLMDAQILEKIFLKSSYQFEGKHAITLGGFMTYGFSPKKYFTASSCEMGVTLGASF